MFYYWLSLHWSRLSPPGVKHAVTEEHRINILTAACILLLYGISERCVKSSFRLESSVPSQSVVPSQFCRSVWIPWFMFLSIKVHVSWHTVSILWNVPSVSWQPHSRTFHGSLVTLQEKICIHAAPPVIYLRRRCFCPILATDGPSSLMHEISFNRSVLCS